MNAIAKATSVAVLIALGLALAARGLGRLDDVRGWRPAAAPTVGLNG